MAAPHAEIGERIRTLRDERNVSQLELAGAIGMSTAALRELEWGNSAPKMKNLIALADYFNVPIDYLARGIYPSSESGSGLDEISLYRITGLNALSVANLQEQTDWGKECGGLDEYVALLNAVISGGFLRNVWGLKVLNAELSIIDDEIKHIKKDNPKPKDAVKSSREELLYEMQLNQLLAPLQERRDLLKLRFFRSVESNLNDHIIKGGDE